MQQLQWHGHDHTRDDPVRRAFLSGAILNLQHRATQPDPVTLERRLPCPALSMFPVQPPRRLPAHQVLRAAEHMTIDITDRR
jgi:hypothetical protein